jgi:hypothetical protein
VPIRALPCRSLMAMRCAWSSYTNFFRTCSRLPHFSCCLLRVVWWVRAEDRVTTSNGSLNRTATGGSLRQHSDDQSRESAGRSWCDEGDREA